MAVLPSFDAAQSPAAGVQLGLTAQNDAQNWMTQAANRQETAARTGQIGAQTQLTQAETNKLQTMLPALQAEAYANTLTFQAKAQQAQIVQQARARAAQNAPAATQEFMGIMGNAEDPMDDMAVDENGNPDYGSQYSALAAWQAKNSYMAQLPEYHDLWNQVEQSKQNAFNMDVKNNAAQIHMQQLQSVQDALTQRAVYQGGVRQNVAQTQAGAQEQVAGIRAGATTQAAAERGQATQNSAAIRAYADTAKSLRTAASTTPDPTQRDQLNQQADQFELLQRTMSGEKISPKEAAKLPAGTQFIGVDGQPRTAIGEAAAAPAGAAPAAASDDQTVQADGQ